MITRRVSPGLCDPLAGRCARARQPASKPGRQTEHCHCTGKPASRLDMPGSERASSRAFQRYLNIAIGQVVREQQRSLGAGRHRLFLPCTKLTTSLCIEQQVQRGSTNDQIWVCSDASRRRRRPDGVGLEVAPSVQKKRSVQRLCLGNGPSETSGRGNCATSWTGGVDCARVHRMGGTRTEVMRR